MMKFKLLLILLGLTGFASNAMDQRPPKRPRKETNREKITLNKTYQQLVKIICKHDTVGLMKLFSDVDQGQALMSDDELYHGLQKAKEHNNIYAIAVLSDALGLPVEALLSPHEHAAMNALNDDLMNSQNQGKE